MNKFHAMGLFTKTGLNTPQFHKYKNDHIFTGLDIVTLLLEANNIIVNYSGTPKTYDDLFIPYMAFNDNEKYTIIKDGKMLQGVLDSAAIGNKKSGGLYHIICREYGADKTLEIIYYFQQIVLAFLINSGVTVSTSDLCISEEANKEIHSLCDIVNTESELIAQKLINENIIPPIDSTIHDFYESMQLNALKLNDSQVLKTILTNIDPDTNGFFKMISVGSKGNINNMIHVSAAIGQITINGERKLRHRIVAENLLNRKLSKSEIVHHVNGIKTDNDPKNLWIFPSQKEHAKFHWDGTIHEGTIFLKDLLTD
jgi:DNA-directed RNA polymerase beta' subunit